METYNFTTFHADFTYRTSFRLVDGYACSLEKIPGDHHEPKQRLPDVNYKTTATDMLSKNMFHKYLDFFCKSFWSGHLETALFQMRSTCWVRMILRN